jgi:hypothetical protein
VAQLATLAGIAALVVAFVPMGGWIVGCRELGPDATCLVPRTRFPVIGYWVHAGAAGLLFAILAFFCLFVFTKIPLDAEGDRQAMTPAKRRRNAIYIVSGVVIAVSALSIAVGDQLVGEDWRARNLTFWAEALILAAFGASWLTQGRALSPLNDPRDQADAEAARAQKDERPGVLGFGPSD